MSSYPSSLVDHAACAGCAHHRRSGSGCAVVDAGAGTPLDGFLAREPCYLKERLREFSRRFLAHRPRSLLEPDDVAQDVYLRLLSGARPASADVAPSLAGFLAFQRQIAISVAISAERRERGRVRCGNCVHFAPYSEICLQSGHPWTHVRLKTSQDPRRLEPPCRSFVALRDPKRLDERTDLGTAIASDEVAIEIEAFHEALVSLAASNPRAALVVRARLVEGRTYEELARPGLSVRTMKRDFAAGIAFLRTRLTAPPAAARTKMAPGAALSRSQDQGRP